MGEKRGGRVEEKKWRWRSFCKEVKGEKMLKMRIESGF